MIFSSGSFFCRLTITQSNSRWNHAKNIQCNTFSLSLFLFFTHILNTILQMSFSSIRIASNLGRKEKKFIWYCWKHGQMMWRNIFVKSTLIFFNVVKRFNNHKLWDGRFFVYRWSVLVAVTDSYCSIQLGPLSWQNTQKWFGSPLFNGLKQYLPKNDPHPSHPSLFYFFCVPVQNTYSPRGLHLHPLLLYKTTFLAGIRY